jgi:seryl-tRNA synthetase
MYIAVIVVCFLLIKYSKQPRLSAFLRIQEQNEQIKKQVDETRNQINEIKKEVDEVLVKQEDNRTIINQIHESNCRIEKFLESKSKE